MILRGLIKAVLAATGYELRGPPAVQNEFGGFRFETGTAGSIVGVRFG